MPNGGGNVFGFIRLKPSRLWRCHNMSAGLLSSRQRVADRQGCSAPARRRGDHLVSDQRFLVHHFAAGGHLMLRCWIASKRAMKLARIYLNLVCASFSRLPETSAKL